MPGVEQNLSCNYESTPNNITISLLYYQRWDHLYNQPLPSLPHMVSSYVTVAPTSWYCIIMYCIVVLHYIYVLECILLKVFLEWMVIEDTRTCLILPGLATYTIQILNLLY